MGTIDRFMKGVTDYFKSPARDPARVQTLTQTQANLRSSIKELDAEIGRLEPGGWSAAAKATRTQNAPRVTELKAQRSQLSDQLFSVEQELMGGKNAYSSRMWRDLK